jgi:hypothetical protein
MINEHIYSYIALQETNYKPLLDFEILTNIENPSLLLDIHQKYCRYKNFTSVQPIFHGEFTDPRCEFVTYKIDNKVVAWTMLRKLGDTAIDNMQFCWDYEDPKLKLGYKSIRTECAIYRDRGFTEMLIDTEMYYKKQLQGYSIYGAV